MFELGSAFWERCIYIGWIADTSAFRVSLGAGCKHFKILRRGVHMNAVFSSLNMDLMLINSFAFQAIRNPSALFTKLCCGIFCEFWGDFWVYLGRDIFSQRIS